MPYIPEDRKDALEATGELLNPGELTYFLFLGCIAYAKDHGVSYQTYTDIMGSLTNTQQEFYRRFVAPYEDLKMAENGDVVP